MTLTPEDHQRINAAIARAETATSGEIFCVLSRQASEYRDTPLFWAAAASLVLPAMLIPLGFSPAWFDWVPGFGGWTAGHAAAADTTGAFTLIAYAGVQAVTFLVPAATSRPHPSARPRSVA